MYLSMIIYVFAKRMDETIASKCVMVLHIVQWICVDAIDICLEKHGCQKNLSNSKLYKLLRLT